ncbi:MAG: Motility accessory factor [Candidatus Ozemobacter sibiricus]|uniref:Motility accessory factor n=1 Tax=Candidatus Ozemobacter sibiricus TaxID=2268124 RepID=A0A367ZNU9_9BACT|nr:MAG: Motility accessory factor [Candidatus Ozemobacter sibiricus]
MTTTCLEANRRVLARQPQLAVLLAHAPPRSAGAAYHVLPAKDGSPTLIVTEPGGKPVTYHSRYDPVGEARKQVESAYAGQSHALVFGCGLGYLLDQIQARLGNAPGQRLIFVIEPDPEVFRLALAHRDLRAVLDDPRFIWCVGQTPDQVGDTWSAALDWAAMEQLAIIEHPPTLARFPDYFAKLKEKIRFQANRSKGNLVTIMKAGHHFHTNTFRNVVALAILPGVGRLFDKFRGVPGVVLAAGPSLEKNLHLLKEVQDRFLLIATDTVLRPMVARGMRPHIVCAGDPSYLNSLDFVGVEDLPDVWLALEPMTSPDIRERYRGPQMVMNFGSGLGALLEPLREPIGRVVCWGSIATTAFDLARRLGCDPIIFVGLDLSFQDGRLYIRGSYSDDVFFDKVHPYSSLEQETLEYIMRRGTHRFTNAAGQVLYTDENMFLYRGWFEDQLQQTDRTVINATEGGVMTNHVKIQTLRETIDQYLHKGAPIADILGRAMAEPVRVRVPEMRAWFEGVRRELAQQDADCRRVLHKLRRVGKKVEGKSMASLDGPSRAEFDDAQALHEKVGAAQPLFQWFTVHQAKFLTRHNMELRKLMNAPDAACSAWFSCLEEFFEAHGRFVEYQMPLLEGAIKDLEAIIARMGVRA